MNNSSEKAQTVGIPTVCRICGRTLVPDECALTKKLINRGAMAFYCVHCLAAYFEVTPRDIQERIEYFKSTGCTLFGSEA